MAQVKIQAPKLNLNDIVTFLKEAQICIAQLWGVIGIQDGQFIGGKPRGQGRQVRGPQRASAGKNPFNSFTGNRMTWYKCGDESHLANSCTNHIIASGLSKTSTQHRVDFTLAGTESPRLSGKSLYNKEARLAIATKQSLVNLIQETADGTVGIPRDSSLTHIPSLASIQNEAYEPSNKIGLRNDVGYIPKEAYKAVSSQVKDLKIIIEEDIKEKVEEAPEEIHEPQSHNNNDEGTETGEVRNGEKFGETEKCEEKANCEQCGIKLCIKTQWLRHMQDILNSAFTMPSSRQDCGY